MRKPSFSDRALIKYYLYSGLSVWQFIVPINVLFMRAQGLSFAEMSATLAAFSLGIVAGEIPTGYVGDRIGRRKSLLLGVYLVAGSIFIYGLSTEFWQFLTIYIIWAVGITFMSGSGQAWLYDVLKQSDDGDQFAHIRGRASALNAGNATIAIFAGGYLYSIDHFYPFLAAAVFMATAGLILLTFPASRDDEASSEFDLGAVVALLRHLLTQSPNRAFIFYAAVLAGGFAVVGGVYVQPMTKSLGASERQIGWLFATATGIGAIVNPLAGRIKDQIGVERWFWATPLVVAALLVFVVVAPVLVIPLFLLVRGWNNISKLLRNQYLNDHVAASENRSTVISAVSMGVSLVEALFLFATGFIADFTAPAVAVGTTGVVLLVVAVVFVGVSTIALD